MNREHIRIPCNDMVSWKDNSKVLQEEQFECNNDIFNGLSHSNLNFFHLGTCLPHIEYGNKAAMTAKNNEVIETQFGL